MLQINTLFAVDNILTPNILTFITKFEGCHLKAYKCPAGVWTIGIGNTSHAGPGKVITNDIAQTYLLEDCKRFEKHVNLNVNRKLKMYEYHSLVSFTFNVGYRITGDLRTYINLGLTDKVTGKLNLYTHAGKKVLNGLVRRRAAECKLYSFGIY